MVKEGEVLETKYKLIINGDRIHCDDFFDVVNPATGKVFDLCPEATDAHIDFAVDSAAEAFKTWSIKTLEERRSYLLDCASALEHYAPRLAKLITKEQGKPLNDANMEIMIAAHSFRACAALDLEPELVVEDAEKKVEVHYKPLGVVAGITAWNYPIVLAAWKLAPALLAGNTFVMKPSPYTPLSSILLAEVFSEILPAGVYNVITGSKDQGRTLVEHKKVAEVSFTGSTAVGKMIAVQSAEGLKRLTLELGGNDAAIVLQDADLDEMAPKLFAGAFVNNGQTCVAVKRIYVHASIYHDLRERLENLAAAAMVGDGMDPDNRLGPICNKAQFDRVSQLVDSAEKSGARVFKGGVGIPDMGYFYPPTIISDIDESCSLVTEEQFGPVVPLISFSDEDEAIARANDSEFGLGGSIWTKDVRKGAQLATRLESGSAWVNSHPDFCLQAPFGGAKFSGIGVENGRWGLKSFTQIQTVTIPK